MTKWIALPAAFVAAAALALNVEAAPKTNAKPNSPKTTTKPTTKGQSTKGSPTTTKGPSTKGPSTKSAGTTKTKGPKSTTTTTTTAKGNGSSKKSGSTTTASTSTTSTSPTTTTTEWKPTNAVAEKLMTKPNQLAKLKAALGDSTIDINDATAGFKNFGQLNAAVNVSQNLGIDFADLKAAMTGITIEGEKTNQPTKSLGQAIQMYRTDVDAEAEAAAATAQATRDGGQ